MTPTKAATIGSTILSTSSNGTTTRLETICASIASYRDPECSATVADIFERAQHPERLRVANIDQRLESDPVCGVCNANETTSTTEAATTLCQFASQIDRLEVNAHLSVGPVFARHLAHRLYRGEYFAMQLDAHVRFT